MFRLSAVISIFSLSIFLIASNVSAKQSLPPSLIETIEAFSEFEESYEEGRWQDALAILAGFEDNYASVFKQNKKEIPSTGINRITDAIDRLKVSLTAKSAIQTKNYYTSLRIVTFDVIELFEYQVHPALSLMEEYIGDEAQEALTKGDFEEVQSELEEVHTFLRQVIPLLKEHGVTKDSIGAFDKNIRKAMRLAANRDEQNLGESLNGLEKQLATFRANFK